MNEKRWVQHISGQGEKFAVSEEYEVWRVRNPVGHFDLWLPKSEYRLCDPPEVWEIIGDRYVEMVYVHDDNGKREEGTFRVKLTDVEKLVRK